MAQCLRFEQVHLIYGLANSSHWLQRGCTGQGKEGTFPGDGDILSLDKGSSYTGVCICQNSGGSSSSP